MSASRRGLMFVPAQAGLGCPFWDAGARALWIGVELATGRADLVRAVYDGLALRAAQLVDAIRRTIGAERISIDGGLSRSGHFQRVLADALGRTVLVSDVADMTAKSVLDLCGSAAPANHGQSDPGVSWRAVEALSPFPEEFPHRLTAAVERSRRWA